MAPAESALSRRGSLAFALAVLLGVGYASVVAYFSASALIQDSPNHLARAVVVSDLLFHHGEHFSGMFEFQFRPAPYVLCDLALAGLVALFGPSGAASLWNAFVLLTLPAALYWCVRSCGVSRERSALALLLALYLSTDWFFVKGFFAFRIAVALILVSVALARALRASWSRPLYAVFVLSVAAGYLVHLTALLFTAYAVGIGALLTLRSRPWRLRREFCLIAPLIAAIGWQWATARHYGDPVASGTWYWATVAGKLRGVEGQFLHYSPHTDLTLFLCMAACLVWPLHQGVTREQFKRPAVLENVLLALGFALLYCALPVGRGNIWFIDARAIEMAALFAILAALLLADAVAAERPSSYALALTLGALLATANLAYLAKHLEVEAAWLHDYRQIVADIPAGSVVLPVYNAPLVGAVRPRLHAGSFVVIDRQALSPYLFSADTGDPMTYFRYVDRPYAPIETWYRNFGPVDWDAVRCRYDYVLVMQPFDAARMPPHAMVVAGNQSASLLKIAKQECAAPV